MLVTRSLLLLAIHLYCTFAYAETNFPESFVSYPEESGHVNERKTFVDCNLLEKYHQSGQISPAEYRSKLEACKGTVWTDVKPTDTSTDALRSGLKIYFADDDINDDHERPGTESVINGLPIQTAQNENNLQKILLTSNDDRQLNSRHELYKNPKTPQIQFRTESPSSLRSVASPLLVQNSVRNKLREKERRPARRKRDVQRQKGSNGLVWPKGYQINGATWFKRYQALYNDMLRRTNYQTVPYEAQQALRENVYIQQPIAAKSIIPNRQYAYNYVYPLYHLHSDGINYQNALPSYDLRKQDSQMQLRSRNTIPGMPESRQVKGFSGLKTFQGLKTSRPFLRRQPILAKANVTRNYAKGLSESDKHNGSQPSNVVYHDVNKSLLATSNRNLNYLRDMRRRIQGKMMTVSSTSTQEINPTQDHALQRIGLKDDASFMDATPNFDRSELTLHAVQSLIPKAHVRDNIAQLPRNIKQAASSKMAGSGLSLLKNSPRNILKNNVRLKVGGSSNIDPTLNRKEAGILAQNDAIDTSSTRGDQEGFSMDRQNQERSEIARPKLNTNPVTKQNIALSFYTERRKPTIGFPPEESDEKKDVIYTTVNPSSEVDSDDITAENLAAIFNELDGEIDRVLHADAPKEEVTKKDVVARAKDDVGQSQNEIEMTVYDTSTNASKSKGVQFVNSMENETNLEQSLEFAPIETEETARPFRPQFNLKQLHFGLRNGNTFD